MLQRDRVGCRHNDAGAGDAPAGCNPARDACGAAGMGTWPNFSITSLGGGMSSRAEGIRAAFGLRCVW